MMGSFKQGFLIAIILISLLLGSQYGPYFNYLSEDGLTVLPSFGTALNWQTAIILSLVFILVDRNQGSILMPLVAWSIFDTLWIVKHCNMGNFLFGSNILTYPTTREIIIGFARNFLIFIFSMGALIEMKFNTPVKILFGLLGLYWVFLIYPIVITIPHKKLSEIFPLMEPPIYYAVNFIPFIAAFKEWTGKTWKKFLFY